MRLVPKSWSDFQHYKDRSPAWIKLHKRLLDDYEFQCLPVASRALAPMLWLLASEYENGVIEASADKLAFRIRMRPDEFSDALKPLIKNGFFILEQDASEPLAERYQNSIPEKERETETQVQNKKDSEEGEPSSGASAGLKSDRPPWWPQQDRYGRVVSDVTEKIVFDVGKAVLGKSAGGQVTRLRKLYRGDMRAVTDILLQAEEKSDPAEWIAGVIKRGDVDEITPTKSEIYPEFAY